MSSPVREGFHIMLPSRTSCIIPYRTSYDLVTIERKMLEPRLIESVPTPLHFWIFDALSYLFIC